MSMTAVREPVEARAQDRPALKRVVEALGQSVYRAADRPKLVGPGNDEIDLPEAIYKVLRQAVRILLAGDGVSIVPVHKELTTQEAADLLNVSRPYLVRLLNENRIPHTKTGTHRRIKFGDLMEFKRTRDTERRQRLAELTALTEELGLYDTQ